MATPREGRARAQEEQVNADKIPVDAWVRNSSFVFGVGGEVVMAALRSGKMRDASYTRDEVAEAVKQYLASPATKE